MTAKEKAEEITYKFYFNLPNNGSFTGINNIHRRWEESCQCALITIDEILFVVSKYNDTQAEVTYWEEVKIEIKEIWNKKIQIKI